MLATGDYLGNEDMMKFYAPECIENGIQILSIDTDDEGNYTNVGEGHKMGHGLARPSSSGMLP